MYERPLLIWTLAVTPVVRYMASPEAAPSVPSLPEEPSPPSPAATELPVIAELMIVSVPP